VDDGGLIRINLGGTRQERQRRQRLEIRGIPLKIGIVGRSHYRCPENTGGVYY